MWYIKIDVMDAIASMSTKPADMLALEIRYIKNCGTCGKTPR